MDLLVILIGLFQTPLAIFLVVLGVMGVALFFAGMALITVGPWVLAWVMGRKLRRATQQRDARGQPVRETLTARLGIANLPVSESFVAGLGRDRAPHRDLNSITMKPTYGIIALTLVLSALAMHFVLFAADAIFGDHPLIRPALAVAIAFSLIRTLGYSVRYDTEGLSTRGAFYQRQEARWSDVSDIRDNGQYFYIIRLRSGGKIEVFKYLVGIPAFLAYAKDQMAYHENA